MTFKADVHRLFTKMVSIIYVSSAVELFSKTELVSLLEVSCRNNSRSGITGMLLYKDGNFMQVIEGEAIEIYELQAKISRDPRHERLITLLEKPITERRFNDWSMGFKNLTDPDVHALPGYSEFLNTPLTDKAFVANPTRAERLLQTFKQRI